MNIGNKTKTAKVIFILSILTAAYWVLGQLVDVYYYAVIGAVFELLWLPMLIMLVALPILALIYWVRTKFELKSMYLYALVINLATLLCLILF